MGYIFTLGDLLKYTEWSRQPGMSRLLNAGLILCTQMLTLKFDDEILDIGCGSCFSLLKLKEMGFSVRGLEASPDIVSMVRRKHALFDCVDIGLSHDMPYEDNAFNYSCFFNSLEYIDDPELALAEAFRVTRQKVFIGFFNRYAATYFRHRIFGSKSKSFFKQAHFFSLWEIKNMVHNLLGPVPIQWQNIMLMPLGESKSNLLLPKYMPFGAFIGVTVTVSPRFTTNALHLKYECPSGT